MENFFIEHWIDLLFGLLSIGIVAYARFLYKTYGGYKDLLEKQHSEKEQQEIDENFIQPIELKVAKLENYVKTIREFYKYRLIDRCQIYLKKGYMTSREYENLTEFYKVYRDMDGNGQAKDFYLKAKELPVYEEKEKKV